jgi:hypothetical protein
MCVENIVEINILQYSIISTCWNKWAQVKQLNIVRCICERVSKIV